MLNIEENLQFIVSLGKQKISKSSRYKIVFGFLGGMMVALGYLSYIKAAGMLSSEYGALGSLIGACLFPIGLVFILLIGGELITSNMMVLSYTLIKKEISFITFLKNLGFISLMNIIGAVSVAFVFGHLGGMTSSGTYLEMVNHLADGKVQAEVLQAFISGIGCNIFVCFSVWMAYSVKSYGEKFLAIWFPIMIFALLGFQHNVANAFLIPASIFEGNLTWMDFIGNYTPVYLGNFVGAFFVAWVFQFAIKKNKK